MCIQGGYKTVTPVQIANCFGALSEDVISYRSVRVYFACLSLVATREAAKRDATKKGRRPLNEVRYRISELCAVTGLTPKVVRRELRSLQKAALLSWGEKALFVKCDSRPGTESLLQSISGKRSPIRPIPVPRAVLRFVARTTKAALGKTVMAYVVRGLSIDRKDAGIRAAGTVKASWIADVFGLSLRSVKAARRVLIDCGFITKDTGSFQRKLNRDGAYFKVNLAWHEGKGEGLRIAPRAPQKCSDFAPPYNNKKTSYESKNQKTESCTLKLTGVCKANPEKPTLRDVKPEDLKRYSRLRLLFEEAVSRKWIQNTEANFLNWLAAAVRAQTVHARSPVRVFISIVKQRRWDLITQAQEDRARASILRNRQRAEGENARLTLEAVMKSRDDALSGRRATPIIWEPATVEYSSRRLAVP